MTVRDELHRLIDTLPEQVLADVRQVLEHWQHETDPVARALRNAPEDDEPLTPEQRAAIGEGVAALANGDVYSIEEVERGLGRRTGR